MVFRSESGLQRLPEDVLMLILQAAGKARDLLAVASTNKTIRGMVRLSNVHPTKPILSYTFLISISRLFSSMGVIICLISVIASI